MSIDLNLSPLYRVNGRESASMPGLLTTTPPRKPARGRDQDRLVVYLLLTGNAVFSTAEYMQIAAQAANTFYKTPGSLTHALRAGAEAVNHTLFERNMSTSGHGQYATGWLALVSLRDSLCTLLLSGPLHFYMLTQSEIRHIYEPSLSGRGLGLSQSVAFHLSQTVLQPHDRLLLCGKLPSAWESALTSSTPASLEATRRRLVALTSEDFNAVLIQAAQGTGNLIILRRIPDAVEEPAKPGLSQSPEQTEGTVATSPRSSALVVEEVPDTHGLPQWAQAADQAESGQSEPVAQYSKSPSQPKLSLPAIPAQPAATVQPSAYAIPPQPAESIPVTPIPVAGDGTRNFPSSIPRAKPQDSKPEPPVEEKRPNEKGVKPEVPRAPSERMRQAAKALAGGIQALRQTTDRIGAGLGKFVPRLLPGTDTGEPATVSTPLLVFIAVLIPILVVAAAFTVYSRYGRSLQYGSALAQAQEARTQARSLTDPVEQRKAWENVLLNVEKAGSNRETDETKALKQEAEANLDQLLGILRLQFVPAFSSPLGIDISRMAATETDLFMLDAAKGEVLHAGLTDERGFQLDTAFNCEPGVYGNYTVGPLVDILALPGLNSLQAELLGVDANGNLLYCEPGQVPQAIPLSPPDTNWSRVTAFTLDAGNLYVLDAPARAVWVYVGKDGTFIDRPYFFFGGQTPEKQDVIDLAVSGDDLYMLHADGHLSTCSYSRIETVPTRCQDPAALVNPYTAYKDSDLFTQAHFTQMLFNPSPDQSILLLDADSQGVFRLTPRSLELQNQLRPATGASNPIHAGPVGAMTVSPNHVLFLAVKGQVYFATGMP
jgi:hypothetical protein